MGLPKQDIVFDNDEPDLHPTQVLSQTNQTATAYTSSGNASPVRDLRAHRNTEFDFSGHPPAGIGARIVATLVDGALYTIITQIVQTVVILNVGAEVVQSELQHQFGLYLLSMALGFCYYVAPLYVCGQTLGKKLLSIRVVNREYQGDLGWSQCASRESIGKFLSAIPLMLGFLIAVFREDKKSLHDLLFRTQVISLKSKLSNEG